MSVLIFKTEGHDLITKKSLLCAVVMTLAIVIFHAGDKHKSVGTELKGLVFGILSLLFDCFVNFFQSKVKQNKEITFLSMLQITNFWCFVFSFLYSFLKGEAQEAWPFAFSKPQVFSDLILNCLV